MTYSSLSSTTLAFLLLSLSFVFSQQQQPQPPPPTMAGCGPLLLPLVPCAPFVQGAAISPSQQCCDSLNQLYAQQPGCLCLLLNNTSALSTFPINITLASQLPILCSLQADNTTICSEVAPPANPPASLIPSGRHPNSTIAVSPVDTMTPRTSILGYRHNEGIKLKIKSQFVVLICSICLYVV